MVTAEMKLLVRPTRAVSNADKLLLVTIISLFTFFMPGQTHDMRVLRAAAANVS